MMYPEIWKSVISRLNELEFEGLDANIYTSIFEYGGLYSPKYELAFLVEVTENGKGNPGICMQRISKRDIRHAIERAGGGFQYFTDNTLPPGTERYMDVIQSMMLWNGGWQQNSAQWKKLRDWEEEEMLYVISRAIKNNS